MFLEPVRKHRRPGDDPSLAMRLGVLVVISLIVFSILAFRLWYLQILSGDRYVTLAENNRLRTVVTEAPRGVIYDRNNVPLVMNRAGLSVGILPMDLRDEERVLSRLAGILGLPEVELRAKAEKAKQDPYRVTIIKEDVPENPVVTYLAEHSLEFPGVTIEKSYSRSYPRKAFATHLLGYVGEISPADLEKEQYRRTFRAGARIGKDGVEATYDSYLRGTDGSTIVEVDAYGRPKRVLSRENPKAGNNLVLTIDSVLQEAAERAIVEGIERAHRDGFKKAAGGAVIALDPRNGEILAITSFPDYDPSLWVGSMRKQEFARLNAKQANNPLFNRAIMGQYPAGSTFKPFVAATALERGLITKQTKFFCEGSYRLGRQVWKCWKAEGHRERNVIEALMMSCDVYFYNIGKMMYEQQGPVLQSGLRQLFGFGGQTDVDLPGEQEGRVPDREWKQRTGRTELDRLWKPGDEINLAIGQGDLLVTPLQLAAAYATIANGKIDPSGDTVRLERVVPHLGLQITDANGNVIHQFEPEKRISWSMDRVGFEAILRGLSYVIKEPDGTAHDAFRGFPIPVAGKTGTAEKKPEDDYAWFVGYAPADSPQIVVVALIEQGGHGSSVAAPVVRRVMEAFFHVKSGVPGQVRVTE